MISGTVKDNSCVGLNFVLVKFELSSPFYNNKITVFWSVVGQIFAPGCFWSTKRSSVSLCGYF